jgi:hypothetical protein
VFWCLFSVSVLTLRQCWPCILSWCLWCSITLLCSRVWLHWLWQCFFTSGVGVLFYFFSILCCCMVAKCWAYDALFVVVLVSIVLWDDLVLLCLFMVMI